ncbi:MAG: hypothetical protein OSA97_15230, partial [Nevskia sp.]|nr:hypothetical protein [Nevskia sp.]
MKRQAASGKQFERRGIRRTLGACAAAGVLAGTALPAAAFKFDLDSGFSGAFDSTVSYGIQMRMQGQACGL